MISGYVSAVYFSNWSIYEAKHFVDDLPAAQLTHVFYAFLKINPETGACEFSDSWADAECPMRDGTNGSLELLMQMKRRHRNLKTIMSIGGWGTEHNFQKMMRSKETLHNFILTTLAIVKKYKFDGVDIDWEYPRTASQGAELVHLLSELRAGLRRFTSPVILTAALPAAEENIQFLNIPLLSAQLTYLNIMCYDFCAAGWSERTGYHSNLFGANGNNNLNAESAIKSYIARGAYPGQLLLGMPMYGHSFPNPEKLLPGQRFIRSGAKTEPIEYRKIDRSEEVYNEDLAAASTYDVKTGSFITYDSPACVFTKAQYVRRERLAGGFFWDSKGDTKDHALIGAFYKGIGGDLQYEMNNV